ncbi:MAG: tyrosine transporter [Candidatus Protochlamydia sp.]|nr:tyrosine transporter [Candidatus Protochlamydia sp.]
MDTYSVKKGSLLGGILLVAGCCIGAGMLGLPVLSAKAGFIPSSAMFIICWLFMLTTGLLYLEVNLWFGEEINILTMAEKTLGKFAKGICWFVYLFLFYSLMVAYVAASGSLISGAAEWAGLFFSQGIGAVLFCIFFGFLLFLGLGAVDWFNRFLMGGLIVTYVWLVALGLPHVDISLLKNQEWNAATMVIPAAIISFGFHNLIPSLTKYYKSHVKSLVTVLVLGSAIPLVIYLLWEWVILGLTPLIEFQEALDQGEIATQALKDAVGTSWIGDIAQTFAFFAILTSFLSVAISFVDFLADGLSIKKDFMGKIILALLVLIPPLLFALFYPSIFLEALNYAGGYGAVIIYGIIPALMIWEGRYRKKLGGHAIVPGGKPLLIAVILFSAAVMILQFTSR